MPVHLPSAEQTPRGERTMSRRFRRALIAGPCAILLTAAFLGKQSSADEPVEVRYLAFQVFTGAPDPAIPIGGS